MRSWPSTPPRRWYSSWRATQSLSTSSPRTAAAGDLAGARGSPRTRRILVTMDSPRFASSLSTAKSSARAEREAVAGLLSGLDGQCPDLLAVFATHHHGAALHALSRRLGAEIGAGAVLGCTGENVIEGAREVEGEPGLALWAGVLPGTRVRSFHVTAIPGPGGEALFSGFPEISEPERASLLVLGEPFSFPVHAFLERLNAEYPGVPA